MVDPDARRLLVNFTLNTREQAHYWQVGWILLYCPALLFWTVGRVPGRGEAAVHRQAGGGRGGGELLGEVAQESCFTIHTKPRKESSSFYICTTGNVC